MTPDGRKGQIYKVQKGDTLWAISQKYLGTPWIWPSVWKENEAEIANPHWIYPGDLIWISNGSMRKLTPEEAARARRRRPGRARRARAGRRPRRRTRPPRRRPEEGDPFASLDSVEVTDRHQARGAHASRACRSSRTTS